MGLVSGFNGGSCILGSNGRACGDAGHWAIIECEQMKNRKAPLEAGWVPLGFFRSFSIFFLFCFFLDGLFWLGLLIGFRRKLENGGWCGF